MGSRVRVPPRSPSNIKYLARKSTLPDEAKSGSG
jgi:hypothetical protein